MVRSRAVVHPRSSQLIRELRLLERRTARSGKDSVDHGVGGSDDHANVLAGAVNLVVKGGAVRFVAPIIVTAPRTYSLSEGKRMLRSRHNRRKALKTHFSTVDDSPQYDGRWQADAFRLC
jgi:hypothetical protein